MLLSYWGGPFSGVTLVSGRVNLNIGNNNTTRWLGGVPEDAGWCNCPSWAMEKVLVVYRDYTTQLYRDCNKPFIRIPMNQPGWLMESVGFFLCQVWGVEQRNKGWVLPWGVRGTQGTKTLRGFCGDLDWKVRVFFGQIWWVGHASCHKKWMNKWKGWT